MKTHSDRTPLDLFDQVVGLPEGKRGRVLAQACGDDLEMLSQVRAMLAADSERSSVLDAGPNALQALSGLEPLTPEAEGWIGPYRIVRLLGQGGMGLVYEAEQVEPIHRRVALKILRPGMRTTTEFARRFEVERRTLEMVKHPGVAEVIDSGTTEGGAPYFVMEFVRGPHLDEYCDQQRLTTRARIQLFLSVCEAVQHAHQKGVVHRDLKPSNVLVSEKRGAPRIIDFGIAKATAQKLSEHTLTAHGQRLGTLAYMSPEQTGVAGLAIDARADVYSLGIILYELLVGVTPIDAQELGFTMFVSALLDEETEFPPPSLRLSGLDVDRREVIANQRSTDVDSLSRMIPSDLDMLVMKAIAKVRARRYGSVAALADDLGRYLDHQPLAHSGSAAESGGETSRWLTRTTVTRLALALTIVVIIAVLGLT